MPADQQLRSLSQEIQKESLLHKNQDSEEDCIPDLRAPSDKEDLLQQQEGHQFHTHFE